jgi:protein SCO1/2
VHFTLFGSVDVTSLLALPLRVNVAACRPFGDVIEALLRDLGFSYIAIAGGFDHVTQTTIIDRDGKIYRPVYGDDFPLPMFMEPMKDVIYGVSNSYSITGIIDRIKFICTVYDPGAGRYRIDYGLAFGSVIAALSLLIFGGILYREWSRTGHA